MGCCCSTWWMASRVTDARMISRKKKTRRRTSTLLLWECVVTLERILWDFVTRLWPCPVSDTHLTPARSHLLLLHVGFSTERAASQRRMRGFTTLWPLQGDQDSCAFNCWRVEQMQAPVCRPVEHLDLRECGAFHWPVWTFTCGGADACAAGYNSPCIPRVISAVLNLGEDLQTAAGRGLCRLFDLLHLLNSTAHHRLFVFCFFFTVRSLHVHYSASRLHLTADHLEEKKKTHPNLHIDLNFPKWISTRSYLPSGASADTRRFCTYGFVYQTSSSPSTWWWVSSPEPRRPSTAGTARAQDPGISPPSPGRSARTGAPPRIPPASPLASCCRTTGPSASRVARDGCTARRPSRVQ